MTWQHFQAFLWLRWRIQINQLKRGGIANVVILALLALMLVGVALGYGREELRVRTRRQRSAQLGELGEH